MAKQVNVSGECPKCKHEVKTVATRGRVTWRGACPQEGCTGVVYAKRPTTRASAAKKTPAKQAPAKAAPQGAAKTTPAKRTPAKAAPQGAATATPAKTAEPATQPPAKKATKSIPKVDHYEYSDEQEAADGGTDPSVQPPTDPPAGSPPRRRRTAAPVEPTVEPLPDSRDEPRGIMGKLRARAAARREAAGAAATERRGVTPYDHLY